MAGTWLVDGRPGFYYDRVYFDHVLSGCDVTGANSLAAEASPAVRVANDQGGVYLQCSLKYVW